MLWLPGSEVNLLRPASNSAQLCFFWRGTLQCPLSPMKVEGETDA